MKIMTHWVPGSLEAAVAKVNDAGWVNDVIQFVPGTQRIKYPGETEAQLFARGAPTAQHGHHIILRVSELRAKSIEKKEQP